MTFNIHHGRGTDGRLDLERIARIIERQAPDVTALQEVDRHMSERSALADQADWLAVRLRAHLAYGANIDRDPEEEGGPRRRYGTAILSRHPILEQDNIRLPGVHEPRGLLRATIGVRGVPLRVRTTHLEVSDAAERLEQSHAILRDIGEGPVILMGDLNATPGQPEIAALTTVLTHAGDGAPTHRKGSIDYVLISGDIRVKSSAVIDDEPAASDHLPVVCDLGVP